MRMLMLIPMLVLCVLATTYAPVEVQAQAAGVNALGARASGLRIAMLDANDSDFMRGLAPWIRGRIDLQFERMNREIRSQEVVDDERVAARVKRRDPAGELGVQSLEDLTKKTAGQFKLWELGVYMLRADEAAKERADANWHEVERDVFQQMTDDDRLVMRGLVEHRNFAGDSFRVEAVMQGTEWHIVNFAFKIGDYESSLKAFVEGGQEQVQPGEQIRAMRSEAEQLATSLRNQARVQYARTGVPPAKLSDLPGVNEDMRTGHYTKVEDTIHPAGDGQAALIAVSLHHFGLGYTLMTFEWNTGEREILWFDTRAELDARLKELQAR